MVLLTLLTLILLPITLASSLTPSPNPTPTITPSPSLTPTPTPEPDSNRSWSVLYKEIVMTSVYDRYFGDFNTDSICITRTLKNFERGEACTVSVDCKYS